IRYTTEAPGHLPESKLQAERRLRYIEKKLDKDPVLAKAYIDKINDHVQKGYARELSIDEAAVQTSKTWYLPHFAVVNPNKPGKIRVVWDAAAKSNGTSLNEQLLTGPDFYNPLPAVLFKFRQRAVPISADIKEMFLRIKIHPEDSQAQRFLWRGEDRTNAPRVYELTSMLFGAVCSPSQAQYIKNRNAREIENYSSKATEAIIYRHYMDDYLDSLDTIDEANQQVKDVIYVHESGGFSICNWISTQTKVFEGISTELIADGMKTFDTANTFPVERVLGLQWNPNDDTFGFNVKFHKVLPEVLEQQRRPTKREVLKIIMSIFDPLGLISHFHIKGKIHLQMIWKSGIGWDDELGAEQYTLWISWFQQIKCLAEIKIPRFYQFPTEINIQLHVCCDASEVAYAAVAYLRAEFNDGKIHTALIMSKTRVAPLKPMTIPRLELLAALVGSKMANFIKQNHNLKISSTYMWTDSQTVLRWIRSDTNRFKT
ncbi:unnamed protein product, partial [Allacma fusca]